MRAKLLLLLASCCLVPWSVGCSDAPPGPEKLPTVPASGVVTYQGQPLPDASVSFQHVDGMVTANGKTDNEGRFTLSTYEAEDGAPVGSYRITVSASAVQEIEPGVLAPEPPGGFESPIPGKYANPTTSGLEATIPEGGKTDLTLDLQ